MFEFSTGMLTVSNFQIFKFSHFQNLIKNANAAAHTGVKEYSFRFQQLTADTGWTGPTYDDNCEKVPLRVDC
jgi:hypothetical protein